LKIKGILGSLNPCRLTTRRLRVRIIELKEDKSDLDKEKRKLSNKVREKQSEIERLKRRLKRVERV